MEIAPLPALLPARYLELEPFCRWAMEKGLRLGVLSDYDPGDKLHALELDRYFAVAVCAQDEQVGVFKPNPRGLHVALRRLGVEPGESVYVGDRPEVDGAMAAASGVAGIVISSREIDCPPGVALARDWFQVRKLIEGRVSSGPPD